MLKIRRIQVEQTPVYDITVPETESFFANNILVHNCAEIVLPTNEERTAVCCLSSLNLEYADEWLSNSIFIRDVAEFLDNVLQKFIDDAPDSISRARYSAMMERSIGVGALGFHAYLQRKNIAFESAAARAANIKIFKHIHRELETASLALGKERGEAPDAIGYGHRFTYKSAIAPNASSSLIVGNTSPSIEPRRANIYRQDTLSGAYVTKNRYLDNLIKTYAATKPEGWYEEVWSDILINDGSVQHVDWLDDHQKAVFKTAFEINQTAVIELASDRQYFIDQSQSLNLFVRPTAHLKQIHDLHFMAWKRKLKTLYYLRSEKVKKIDKVGKKVQRELLDLVAQEPVAECVACEG